MSDSSDEVERILARTRAQRQRLNKHLRDLDCPGGVTPKIDDEVAADPESRRQRLAALARKFNTQEDDYKRGEGSTSPAFGSPSGPSHRQGLTSLIESDRLHTYGFSPTRKSRRILGSPNRSPEKSGVRSPLKRASEEKENALNVTKEVDVDEELEAIESSRVAKEDKEEAPGVSGSKKLLDPQLIKNLRAQGFEETENKSKLFYDFKKETKPTHVTTATCILSSPTKTATEPPRPVSPHKPHPLQFVSPSVNKAMMASPGKSSGSKNTNTVVNHRRPASPVKSPHPLQFVSPQVNRKILAEEKLSSPKSPSKVLPAKPARTWASVDREVEEINGGKTQLIRETIRTERETFEERTEEKTVKIVTISGGGNKTETTRPVVEETRSFVTSRSSTTDEGVRPGSPSRTVPIKSYKVEEDAGEDDKEERRLMSFATPGIPGSTREEPVRVPQSEPAPMTDTASRRSMAEKWAIFEKGKKSNPKEDVDPASLSLSERRALFEKNRAAPPPKPVARFGDPVTPHMLQKQNEERSLQARPTQLFKRPGSPQKQEPSPKKYNRSPSPSKKSNRSPSPPKTYNRSPSPPKMGLNSPTRGGNSPKKMLLRDDWQQEHKEVERRHRSPSPRRASPSKSPSSPSNYPGINSLKRIKVSPPKPGQLYPQLIESSEDETAQMAPRPGTSMSEAVSEATSEAPSLGMAIKRAASAQKLLRDRQSQMPSISEGQRPSADFTTDDDEEMTENGEEADISLDVSLGENSPSTQGGPTPPKVARGEGSPSKGQLSPTASTVSWEYQTPIAGGAKNKRPHNFKTPLVDALESSPQGNLPEVEGTEGSKLIHTISFYRRQMSETASSSMPQQKIVRNAGPMTIPEEEEESEEQIPLESIQLEIRRLQDCAEEQRQRMEQASKALDLCVSRPGFEGSLERVEGERLLLEATHKHGAAMAEIRRLSTLGAIGEGDKAKKNKGHNPHKASKGSISISGLSLPLKREFVQMLKEGGDDSVHYFLVLVKHRHRVIATQMLSTLDGVTQGRLAFPNLINMRDLDFDFQIYLEVYGLQTRRESLPHDVKYHIRKEKSMFNLTPLKKLKKQDSASTPSRRQNPVNSKTIRRPAFGMVGYAIINIQTLKNRAFSLEKVPAMSPLDGGLEMTLTIHSESKIEQRGFLTLFTDVNGYGDWCRRWCRLSGNALHFWRYPEDEKSEPVHRLNLSACVTEEVALAPREVCSRMNTFMLETRRQKRQGDKDSLIMHVSRKSGHTTVRHLFSADTRDERIGWCAVLNRALDNIRAWDPTAHRPRADSQASSSSASTEIW